MLRRSLAVVVALGALAGCNDDASTTEPDSSTLMIAASHGTIANDFTATIDGSGTPPELGPVSIDADTGAITIDGESGDTALYNTELFSGYQIFGSVVISPDRWAIAYPYCMGDSLVDVYTELVGSGGFVLMPATGSCTESMSPADTVVDLPAFTIPMPAASGDATVSGSEIELDHGSGQIAIDGAMQPAVVFNTVDCSTTCGSPGWYELHTLVWDAASEAATFVIVYLEIGTPGSVQLSYGLRLPTLDDPFDNEVLDATWTEPTARVPATAHLPPPWLVQPPTSTSGAASGSR
ncbi:MAG TPA: hypothetical protein VGG28_23520 [Kofleriaceae bacterium]|jgi:hypothetical protein